MRNSRRQVDNKDCPSRHHSFQNNNESSSSLIIIVDDDDGRDRAPGSGRRITDSATFSKTTTVSDEGSQEGGSSVDSLRNRFAMISSLGSESNEKKSEHNDWMYSFRHRLLERDVEAENLFNIYEAGKRELEVDGDDESRKHHRNDVIMITGHPGCGKTRLALSLQAAVQSDEIGLCCWATFCNIATEENSVPVPYHGIRDAFAEFATRIVEEGVLLAEIQASLRRHIGVEEAQALILAIPELAKILPVQEPTENKPPLMEAPVRFVFAFRGFIRAICSLGRRFVLFLDDLHNCDEATLDLLAGVLTSNDKSNFLVVGTCDPNQATDYLSRKLRQIEAAKGEIINLNLKELQEDQVGRVLTDVLGSKKEDIEPLARLISHHTSGNFGKIEFFLRWMEDGELLCWDESKLLWKWDMDEIDISVAPLNKGLLGCSLSRLSADTMKMLKVAAGFGCVLNEKILALVIDGNSIANGLGEAYKRGLIRRVSMDSIMFTSDTVHQAIYNQISDAEKAFFHLEVGQRLWQNIAPGEIDWYIYQILSQLHFGRDTITRANDRRKIASLCLHAGVKAEELSSYSTAQSYLKFGRSMLSSIGLCWREDYSLTLAIHNAEAEVEMCIGNLDSFNEIAESIFKHSRCYADTVKASATKIYALSTSGHRMGAIELALNVLEKLGESFPRHPTRLDLIREYVAVRRRLVGKSDDQLLRLPIIKNKNKLQALQILNTVLLSSYSLQPRLAPIFALRIMKISFDYGINALAPASVALFAMISVTFGRISEGLRFRSLALRYFQKYPIVEYYPRLNLIVHGCLGCWSSPLQETISPLLEARIMGMQTGDTECAALSTSLYCYHRMASNISLNEIYNELTEFHEAMLMAKQAWSVTSLLPYMQLARHLMGISQNPTAVSGDLFDFEETLKIVSSESGMGAVVFRLHRLMACYIFNDIEAAAVVAKSIQLKRIPPTFKLLFGNTFIGLVALAMARRKHGSRQHIRIARRAIRKIKAWSLESPHNCLDKLALLQAERFSVAGNRRKALAKYLTAIALAESSGSSLFQGMANELAAHHLYRVGEVAQAKSFFLESLRVFSSWGACGKVSHLRQQLKQLYPSASHKFKEKYQECAENSDHLTKEVLLLRKPKL